MKGSLLLNYSILLCSILSCPILPHPSDELAEFYTILQIFSVYTKHLPLQLFFCVRAQNPPAVRRSSHGHVLSAVLDFQAVWSVLFSPL